MNPKVILSFSFIIFTILGGSAQRLDRFGDANRFSYNKIVTYFGYADSLMKPDEVHNDTGYYHMYFWLSDSVSEIAVRMISPVPVVVMPDRGDIVSENYYEHEKDKTDYFDTWFSLDRAEEIKEQGNIAVTKNTRWLQLGYNDDSSELFPQPSGNRYNSLMRIKSKHDIPGKTITAGLYRIRFTSYKKGKVKGSYLIQVGTTELLPLKLVKHPEELKE